MCLNEWICHPRSVTFVEPNLCVCACAFLLCMYNKLCLCSLAHHLYIFHIQSYFSAGFALLKCYADNNIDSFRLLYIPEIFYWYGWKRLMDRGIWPKYIKNLAKHIIKFLLIWMNGWNVWCCTVYTYHLQIDLCDTHCDDCSHTFFLLYGILLSWHLLQCFQIDILVILHAVRLSEHTFFFLEKLSASRFSQKSNWKI